MLTILAGSHHCEAEAEEVYLPFEWGNEARQGLMWLSLSHIIKATPRRHKTTDINDIPQL